jgi:hypothetical protein
VRFNWRSTRRKHEDDRGGCGCGSVGCGDGAVLGTGLHGIVEGDRIMDWTLVDWDQVMPAFIVGILATLAVQVLVFVVYDAKDRYDLLKHKARFYDDARRKGIL